MTADPSVQTLYFGFCGGMAWLSARSELSEWTRINQCHSIRLDGPTHNKTKLQYAGNIGESRRVFEIVTLCRQHGLFVDKGGGVLMSRPK